MHLAFILSERAGFRGSCDSDTSWLPGARPPGESVAPATGRSSGLFQVVLAFFPETDRDRSLAQAATWGVTRDRGGVARPEAAGGRRRPAGRRGAPRVRTLGPSLPSKGSSAGATGGSYCGQRPGASPAGTAPRAGEASGVHSWG